MPVGDRASRVPPSSRDERHALRLGLERPACPSRARPSPCCGRGSSRSSAAWTSPGRANGRAEHARREPLADGEPGGVDGLRRVVRRLARDALAPRGHAVGVVELEQQDATRPRRPRRDPERLAQREPNLPEDEAREGQAHRGGVAAGVATGFSIVYINRNNGRSARTAQRGSVTPQPISLPNACCRYPPRSLAPAPRPARLPRRTRRYIARAPPGGTV